MIDDLKRDLDKISNHEKAIVYKRFFKTGPGEYGEGDQFIGATMPEMRIIAKRYANMSIDQVMKLLDSTIHEHRMTGLIILDNRFLKSAGDRQRIYELYLSKTSRINNWDLVDVTCHHIVGRSLIDKDRSVLYKLARSKNLWERRIAIVSTYEFIRNGQFDDTIKISEILLDDKHDLIQKAVGWMLREVGKKDLSILERFLDKHHKEMPRTMLRYSLEKMTAEKKEHYMKR